MIVPQVGRVMRYGYVGGANLLFEDPGKRQTAPNGSFISYGGDKAWIWPQSDWPKMIRRDFPPPPAVDGLPWRLRVLSPRSALLLSDVIEPWGVRIEREVRLDAKGTGVTWVNRLVKVDGRPTPPTAVWSVTQVPVSDLWVRRVQPSDAVGHQLLRDPWAAVEERGRWLRFVREPHALNKSGIHGDQIAVTQGGTRFTQTLISSSPGPRVPTEQAQVFSFPDPGGDHPDQVPYVEVEFTSPRLDISSGLPSVEMTVRWDLGPAGDLPARTGEALQLPRN